MKLNRTQLGLAKALTLGICATMLFAQQGIAKTSPVRKFSIVTPNEEEPAKKEKKSRTTKNFSSLNNNSVKIYPDALKREMHVLAKENDGQLIDFFVFDVQGTLVQNYKMKAKDHYRIAGLARGTYVYRVFTGDEETAAGKFDIR
jgi:hypothetical protein